MADQRIGGGPKTNRTQTGSPAATQKAQPNRVEQVDSTRVPIDPASFDLPPRGLGERQSVLKSVIAGGLEELARAESWAANEKPLGVQVRAMVGAAPTEPPRAAESMPRDFAQLLGGLESDPAQAAQIKQDAERLAALSIAALGGAQGLKDTRKAEQEAQLLADVATLKDALSEVMQKPAEERQALLAKNGADLAWAADVLARGRKALDAAGAQSGARLEALSGMLEIVGRYAKDPAGEPPAEG
jgi:hypothetical protein